MHGRQLAASVSVLSVVLGAAWLVGAQSHAFARGTFTLPFEVSWNKTKLAPGEYRFRVTTMSTGQVRVDLEQNERRLGGFLASNKEFVKGGKGLAPRLVVEIDPVVGAEVRQMEVPGINWRLNFPSQAKKRKGQEADQRLKREEIPLRLN